MTTTTALRTRPLMPNFGVEIIDVDLATADAETLSAVVAAFQRHGALLLRGQSLSPAAQLAFTRQFGNPEGNVRKQFVHPDFPEVYIISNKVVDGRHIGEFDAGYGWHTDMAYAQRPALSTVLHALEVPPEGSDTLIADLCAAWKALPDDERTAIDGLRANHSFAHYMGKRGIAITPEQQAANPDVVHPLVRRHAFDGRKCFWFGRASVKEIYGLPDPKDVSLLDRLLAFGTEDRFVYRHKWRVGDVLCWDNRCTFHTGTPFDHDRYIRVMHRTWVKGEVPA
ncbi:MAG: TauD/TfdA family dioxygenase [Rhodospirillaceae bacterium]|nr:TauD/TfdA family dioxygenase [Rhodospirillaceae bacterium]